MGLRDEMLKKQESKLQEIQEQIQEQEPQTELTQENLLLKSEISSLKEQLIILNQENTTLNQLNKSLPELKKQVEEHKSQNQKLMKRIGELESGNDSLSKKERTAYEEIGRLKKIIDKERSEAQAIRQELHGEKKASDSVINNFFDSIQNMKMAFIGNLVLSAILLVFITIQNKTVFKECGAWFTARATNLYDFFRWLKDGLYMGTYKLIEGKLHAGEVGSNLLTILVMILILAGLFFLGKKLKDEWDLRSDHLSYYCDNGKPYIILKAVISVDIAIGLFVACLTLYEPIKKLMPSMNIFTIWILLTLAGLTVWNGRDWWKGFK